MEQSDSPMLQRAQALFQQTQSTDQALRMAALQELQRIVARFPNNLNYRALYGFALAITGQHAAAIHQAELIAARVGETHIAHFNIGQIFWIAGDPTRSRYHLNLALQYAVNDQERQDALEFLAKRRS